MRVVKASDSLNRRNIVRHRGNLTSALIEPSGQSGGAEFVAFRAFDTKERRMTMAKAPIFALRVITAGCTDLKPMEARIADLEGQVNKLQADSRNRRAATAAGNATPASALAASDAAKRGQPNEQIKFLSGCARRIQIDVFRFTIDYEAVMTSRLRTANRRSHGID
jgi:hypothetical protein